MVAGRVEEEPAAPTRILTLTDSLEQRRGEEDAGGQHDAPQDRLERQRLDPDNKLFIELDEIGMPGGIGDRPTDQAAIPGLRRSARHTFRQETIERVTDVASGLELVLSV